MEGFYGFEPVTSPDYNKATLSLMAQQDFDRERAPPPHPQETNRRTLAALQPCLRPQ